MKAVLHTIRKQLATGNHLALMCVVQSSGSSPGRKGFLMAVLPNGEMTGSVGGGIMEHKLVELCRHKLAQGYFAPFLMRQIHQDGIGNDRSGMICSGEQTIAFYCLGASDLEWVESVVQRQEVTALSFGNLGCAEVLNTASAAPDFVDREQGKWRITLPVQPQEKVYIVGAGHVGVALAHTLAGLDFQVFLLDDRADLNTFVAENNAHHKRVVNYDTIEQFIPEGDQHYVVIMSFGYRTDGLIIRRLLGRNYRYVGMMGSGQKISKLMQELKAEGFSEEALAAIKAPIGLPIGSKTPAEISISIAAELIAVRHRV